MVVKNIFIIIFMCYLLLFIGIDIFFKWDLNNDDLYCLNIIVVVFIIGKIGVEMEVLIVVLVIVFIIYDMIKVIDKGMIIGEMYLEFKFGGKFGDFYRKNW